MQYQQIEKVMKIEINSLEPLVQNMDDYFENIIGVIMMSLYLRSNILKKIWNTNSDAESPEHRRKITPGRVVHIYK